MLTVAMCSVAGTGEKSCGLGGTYGAAGVDRDPKRGRNFWFEGERERDKEERERERERREREREKEKER